VVLTRRRSSPRVPARPAAVPAVLCTAVLASLSSVHIQGYFLISGFGVLQICDFSLGSPPFVAVLFTFF
jgi:hypothetical protein